MSAPDPDELSQLSLLELFRVEADAQTTLLIAGLLRLERNPGSAPLEELMRAAHSLKGAARIINFDSAVRVAHAMEDVLVAAQTSQWTFARADIDTLLGAADLMTKMARTPEQEMSRWAGANKSTIEAMVANLSRLRTTKADGGGSILAALGSEPVAFRDAVGQAAVAPDLPRSADTSLHVREQLGTPTASEMEAGILPPGAEACAVVETEAKTATEANAGSHRVLRVTAERLNRLLGLAGESLVESRWLSPFADSLLRLKRLQTELSQALDGLREATANGQTGDLAQSHLQQAQLKADACRQLLGERLVEFELFDCRFANLTSSLYHEALSCRMRPLSDGLQGFPRMVRDLTHALGKVARFEVIGANTQVDRDILQKLEAPLTHLLHNAVDHGLESPEERQRAGKPAVGLIRLEAHHNAGRLSIVVSDDGRGIALEPLRAAVVRRGLTSASTAAQLSEAELLEFLYLPGFSLKETVTEVSGRGVGLDVVQIDA